MKLRDCSKPELPLIPGAIYAGRTYETTFAGITTVSEAMTSQLLAVDGDRVHVRDLTGSEHPGVVRWASRLAMQRWALCLVALPHPT